MYEGFAAGVNRYMAQHPGKFADQVPCGSSAPAAAQSASQRGQTTVVVGRARTRGRCACESCRIRSSARTSGGVLRRDSGTRRCCRRSSASWRSFETAYATVDRSTRSRERGRGDHPVVRTGARSHMNIMIERARMSQKYEKLKTLLTELFQLDQARLGLRPLPCDAHQEC